MTVQYGEGLIDHADLEVFPTSSAAVGVYLPVPRTTRLLLCKCSRATGAGIGLEEVDR